ncbi:glycoside hydrolase family 47 protein [Sporormia fimetaria CBS 119925]|uniref:alpha-1,2-Mannosidase n=1 Tax=Sporormia fimetaria CBS 119925 TaxID=1340428 RepID=A0A6A6VQH0_9PLEO|nr:glycoside hydrolase family 47 protein [Sporormia fimetaria CBS 119925]
MALLRRYGVYMGISVLILYLLYTLSFPYDYSKDGPQRPASPDSPPRYDWGRVAVDHPVQSLIPLPTGEPLPLPKIQFDFQEEDANAKKIRETRREEVKKVFLRSWKNYRAKAWMHDELKPISGGWQDTFGGWAASLIDALDTLFIMGFHEEFRSAMKDVEQIDFSYVRMNEINVFETTIRHLGGLLSAYELSKEEVLLRKAKEIGHILLLAFDTPNHMPKTRWDAHRKANGERQTADPKVLLAELGSLTMEFTKLSQLTGDSQWYSAVAHITKLLEREQDHTKLPGMWPITVDLHKQSFSEDRSFTLGSMADSAYEYLGKMYALLGGLEPAYKNMYDKAMSTAIKHALYRPMVPDDLDLLMPGHVSVEGHPMIDPEMQHLACYAGGMFALGSKIFSIPEHLDVGRKITNACVWAYKASPAGIMPEVSHLYACPFIDPSYPCHWNETLWSKAVASRASSTDDVDPTTNIASLRLPPGFVEIRDRRYILRPEAIESVFILWRITGQQQWQAAAWDMFTAIEKATRTEFGNAALADVSADTPAKTDSQESFWMAETLKYFYLTFEEPGVVSLDEWVFNTEAHPFRLPKRKG